MSTLASFAITLFLIVFLVIAVFAVMILYGVIRMLRAAGGGLRRARVSDVMPNTVDDERRILEMQAVAALHQNE